MENFQKHNIAKRNHIYIIHPMDIFEFELRYSSFKWLSERLHLGWQEEDLLDMVDISWQGNLEKKLIETTPKELQELTVQTYTDYKKTLLDRYKDTKHGAFSAKDYIIRLEYELKVVKEMGYNTYFLIVQDYIKWAKKNHIAVGPWRWSAAWSLMARCTYITEVDPFPYDLLFERFLNPARVSMPDIDIDFEDEKRLDVARYVREKYWEDRFAHIGTFMKLAAKAAFKDVARTMGMPFDRSNAITELISEKTIKESLKAREELQWLYDTDDLVKKTIDAAIKLEGNIRQTWVHACGMIITPEKITNYTSIQYPPNTWGDENQTVVSQFEYHSLEDLGLLKMDFLWLRTLSLIKNTIKIVNARLKLHGNTLPDVLQSYLDTMNLTLPLDDALTFERVLQKGDTSWVFQFEWGGIRAFLVKLKPTSLDDIIAMGALYRPWPLEFIPSYIKRKNWEESVEYMLQDLEETLIQKYGATITEEERKKLKEDLDPILWNTYGIAVYQEQLMFLVQAMAWFSLAEADMLRRGIGKKIHTEIERIKWLFVTKAEEFRDYRPETATWIYEKLIEPAASYSFNKSHSVAYGLISYQTARLKAHYPIEFNAALLRSEEENPEKLAQFISEMQIQWYRILPPHINESFSHVSAIDNTIRLWFLSIKGVGFEVGETIEKERTNNWPYVSLEDFITRNNAIINKKTIESLAKAGAFHGIIDRQTILENSQTILDRTKNGNVDLNAWLFGDLIKPVLQLTIPPDAWKMEKLLMEYDVFKTFVSWHPFDWLYSYCKKKFSLISALKAKEDPTEVKILCFIKSIQRAKKKWFFVKIEDLSDELEFFVKESFDWEKFDILILEWFKAKNLRITKVIRTSLDYIIQEAEKIGLYNPEETVADVKAKRLGKDIFIGPTYAKLVWEDEWEEKQKDTKVGAWKNMKTTEAEDTLLETALDEIEEEMETTKDSDIPSVDSLDGDIEEAFIIDEEANGLIFNKVYTNNDSVYTGQNIWEKEEPEAPSESSWIAPTKQTEETPNSRVIIWFDIPEEPQLFEKAIAIIKTFPWEIEIQFWNKTIFTSDVWVEKLKDLLA